MKPDIVIRVKFYTTEEGGRKNPIEGDFYGCPMFINGHGFDCRLILNGMRLEFGVFYDVPVRFLVSRQALLEVLLGGIYFFGKVEILRKERWLKLFEVVSNAF